MGILKRIEESWRPNLSKIQDRLCSKMTEAEIWDPSEAGLKDREAVLSPRRQRHEQEGIESGRKWKGGDGMSHEFCCRMAWACGMVNTQPSNNRSSRHVIKLHCDYYALTVKLCVLKAKVTKTLDVNVLGISLFVSD